MSAEGPSPPRTAASWSAAVAPARERLPETRRLPSAALFAGAREVRIEHHGVEYRLLQTRQGKLILTK
jgi:hemin uptake protein HemP